MKTYTVKVSQTVERFVCVEVPDGWDRWRVEEFTEELFGGGLISLDPMRDDTSTEIGDAEEVQGLVPEFAADDFGYDEGGEE